MKQTKFKGSFSDLKPALRSLKDLMESVEDHEPKKKSMQECQEADLRDIKRHGTGNNG